MSFVLSAAKDLIAACNRPEVLPCAQDDKRRAWRPAVRQGRISLPLPAAGWRLLPIDDRMPRRLVGLPALARFGDRGLVAAVEQLEAALVVADLPGLRTIGDEQELRTVGILVEMRQPHRLAVGLAILGGAVRQE